MLDDLDFQPSVQSLPAADIKAESVQTSEVFAIRTLAIRIPKEEQNDFIVEVRASQLLKARDKLEKVSKPKFPLYEVLLGISTTFLGAFMGGLASDLILSELKGIIFLVICPIIGVATFVAYVLQRRIDNIISADVANELLHELPDPNHTTEKGNGK